MLSIDYYAQQTGLGRWCGGYKLAITVGTLALCIATDSAAFSLAVLPSMARLALGPGRAPVKLWAKLLAAPLVFVTISCAVVALSFPTTRQGLISLPFFSRFIAVTASSLHTAGLLFCRAMGAVCCLYALTLTTPSHQVIGVLRRLHVPALLTELMSLTYHFIFVLLDTQSRMHTAAVSRMGQNGFYIHLRSTAAIFANLFLAAMAKSSSVYSAMESRLYTGSIQFLEERPPLRPVQVAGAVAYFVVLLVLRRIFLLGGY